MQEDNVHSREATDARQRGPGSRNGPEAFWQSTAQGVIVNRFWQVAPPASHQGGNKLQGISDLVHITNLAILVLIVVTVLGDRLC